MTDKVRDETWTCEVPEHRLDELNNRFERLNKRAADLGCPPVAYQIAGTHWHEEQDEILGKTGRKWLVYTITVTGEAPRLEGWRLAGTLVPLGERNVLKEVPGVEIPTRFRTADFGCDHCGYVRYRKVTHIVHNPDTDEWKQVGSSCIKDFLGHDSPERAARLAAWTTSLSRLTEDLDDWLTEKSNKPRVYWTDTLAYLTACATMIRHQGWVSKSKARDSYGLVPTAWEADNWLRNHKISDRQHSTTYRQEYPETPEDTALAEATLTWVREVLAEQEDLNSYLANVVAACGLDQCRAEALGFLASAIPLYQREAGEAQTREHEGDPHQIDTSGSDWVGEVGQRQDFENLTCLMIRTIPSAYTYSGVTYLHKLAGQDGNIFIWYSDSDAARELGEGGVYNVRGTIKSHDEYRGTRQTKLSRCAVEYVSGDREPHPAEV